MYDAASASAESPTVAQSFTFSRGGTSLPPPASISYSSALPAIERVRELGACREAHRGGRARIGSNRLGVGTLDPFAHRGGDGDAATGPAPSSCAGIACTSWPRRGRSRASSSPSPGILQVELGDADGAIEALEMARALDSEAGERAAGPSSGVRAARAGGRRLIEVTSALAGLSPSPPERASLHVVCARIALRATVGRGGSRNGWLQAPRSPTIHRTWRRKRRWCGCGPPCPPRPRRSRRSTQILQHADESVLPDEPARGAPNLGPEVRPAPAPAFVSAATRSGTRPSYPRRPPGRPATHGPPRRGRPRRPDRPGPLPAVEAPGPGRGQPQRPGNRRSACSPRAPTPEPWGSSRPPLVREPLARLPLREGLRHPPARRAHRRGPTWRPWRSRSSTGRTSDPPVLNRPVPTVGPVASAPSLDESAWTACGPPGPTTSSSPSSPPSSAPPSPPASDELRERRRLRYSSNPGRPPQRREHRLRVSSAASSGRPGSSSWSCHNLYLRDEAAGGLAPMQAREPSTALGPGAVLRAHREGPGLPRGPAPHVLSARAPGAPPLSGPRRADEAAPRAAQVAMPGVPRPHGDPASGAPGALARSHRGRPPRGRSSGGSGPRRARRAGGAGRVDVRRRADRTSGRSAARGRSRGGRADPQLRVAGGRGRSRSSCGGAISSPSARGGRTW